MKAHGLFYYGSLKAPYAALRFILRPCGVRHSTPHSSGLARLAYGAFHFAIKEGGPYEGTE